MEGCGGGSEKARYSTYDSIDMGRDQYTCAGKIGLAKCGCTPWTIRQIDNNAVALCAVARVARTVVMIS
jgi:hypothetical protein